MNRRSICLLALLLAGVPATARAQSQAAPPPATAPVLTPAPATLSAANAPAGPNTDMHYQLGPDSLPQDGVPKGEMRGPFVLPSQAYPGTQHTYWVYVPAQYDPAVPASLMIFKDGQAFKDMDGDDPRAERARQPDLPPRDPGDDRGLHQSRPDARSARADAAGVGRPHDEPADRIQHARRQVRARDRRRADAGRCTRTTTSRRIPSATASAAPAPARSPRSPSPGSGPNQFRKVLSIVGSFTNLRGGDAYPDIVRKSEKKPIRVFLQDGRNDNRGVARTAPTTSGATGSSRTCG